MTRILLVEDNLHARRALKALLSQKSAMQVSAEASNGHEAVECIERHIPDVVIMDMQMPVMNGLEATRIIKRRWPQVWIIILTMYPDYQAEVMKAGADVFLLKGCSVDELATKIQGSEKKIKNASAGLPFCFPIPAPLFN